MENKNYVVVEQGEKYEYNSIEEIIKSILGNDYYELSDKEKYEKIKLRTFINAKVKKLPIIDLEQEDEITFLLSLIKNNDIVVFEKESNKKLTKNIDTTNLRKVSGEYIVVNDCIDQILKDKISKNI